MAFSTAEFFWTRGRNLTNTVKFSCRQGSVSVRLSVEYRDVRAALGPDVPFGKLWNELLGKGSRILPQVTNSVQVSAKLDAGPEAELTAKLSSAEFATLLEGEWPTSDNFQRLACAIRDRNRYPAPEAAIPGEGGKSTTAEGQTKKPGSHSHNRHR